MEASIVTRRRRRLHYSSLRNVAEIPEDVIIDILLRLPIKSLLRFKSVCKTWYHLLKSHSFTCMHDKFNSGTVLLMCSSDRFRDEYDSTHNHLFSFFSNDKSATLLSPDIRILANPHTHVYVAGCCNGVVCYYHLNSSIFLSNPATREFKQLPPTSTPELEHKGVAFGFDSTNDIYDFKVLRLSDAPNKSYRAEMYTLSSNTWKKLHWGFNDNRHLFLNRLGLFCANSFHFITWRCHKNRRYTIACCDIHTERFTTLEFPSNGVAFFNYLMVFKGFLSTVCQLPAVKLEERLIEIWIMKDYGVVECWTKLYTIGPPWKYSVPLCIWTEDDALLIKEQETRELVSCHLNTLSLEPIEIHGYKSYSRFVVYKETLASIM